MLHSGIDLHRRSIVLCTVNDLGAVIARARLQCEREAVLNYFRRWQEPHEAVVECTSNWYWLCDLLAAEGITTVLAHAKYLKAISYAKVKTDAVDAHTLAQLLRMGYVPTAHQLPVAYRPLRDLLRQRMVMEHKRITLLQQTNSILAKFNITELQATASEASFAEFVRHCQLPEEYTLTLLLYHHQCLLVSEHEKELEHYFKSKLRPTQTLRLLVTIPGIGDITGAVIAMETGEITRFPDAKHYASYCRLAPGARDSGGKRHVRSGSKDGNQYLKYAFTEAALKAMQYYPEIRSFAERLSQRANPAIARTVVAKELSKIVYYVLSHQEPCRTFKGVAVAKKRRDWPRTCKPVRLTGAASLLPPS